MPYLGGHPGAYWVTQKPTPASPPWGDPRLFSWASHSAGYDYFLIEAPLDAPEPDPFFDAPAGAVQRVFSMGQWRLYRKK